MSDPTCQVGATRQRRRQGMSARAGCAAVAACGCRDHGGLFLMLVDNADRGTRRASGSHPTAAPLLPPQTVMYHATAAAADRDFRRRVGSGPGLLGTPWAAAQERWAIAMTHGRYGVLACRLPTACSPCASGTAAELAAACSPSLPLALQSGESLACCSRPECAGSGRGPVCSSWHAPAAGRPAGEGSPGVCVRR